MSPPGVELIVRPDAAALAEDVAQRTLRLLAQAQAEHGRAAIALTAGSIMEKTWAAIAADPSARDIEWARVDVFWADERFVPDGSPDRNDGPANSILWSNAPFRAAAQYPMPASDGFDGDDLDAAAERYFSTLETARRTGDTALIPSFDVVLLGLGPDGHCASLFPAHPGTRVNSTMVIGVRDSPKPPPLRISLTFDGLNTARQIWVVASGEGKAEAVRKALSGADRIDVPSAGARGTEATLWLIDEAAASQLGPDRD